MNPAQRTDHGLEHVDERQCGASPALGDNASRGIPSLEARMEVGRRLQPPKR
jgi:hypothetical protein